MAKPRKLWKVTQGWADEHEGPAVHQGSTQRPESKGVTYAVYVPNNVNAARAARHIGQDAYDHSDVWVDERDGHGWRHYERVVHAEHPLWTA